MSGIIGFQQKFLIPEILDEAEFIAARKEFSHSEILDKISQEL